jgi:hypothetical protein
MATLNLRNSNNQTKEIWKDIPEYEGFYQVSNIGNIKSLDRYVEVNRKGGLFYTKKEGRTILPNIDRYGYKKLNLYHNKYNRKTFTVHRLVAIAFIPNPENYDQINHIDGDKLNNHVDNLEWCNAKQNHTHAVKNGLIDFSKFNFNPQKGEDHGNSILTEKEVLSIRNDYKKGSGSYYDLSIKYNTSKPNIADIIKRRSWNHI